MDGLWDEIRPYIVLFGLPLFITIPATFVVWILTNKPFPEYLIGPVAVIATPPFWGGLLLAIFVRRYEAASRRLVGDRTGLPKRARKALKRLERAYVLREWLARGRLRNSVYLAYLLTYWRLRPQLTGHPLNAYRAGHEEHSQLQVRQQQELLGRVAQFVFVTGTGENEQANEQIDACISLLPPGSHRVRLAQIIKNTLSDGPGVLSTLTALTYVHLVGSLPLPFSVDIESVISNVDFDCDSYGWLSNRVLEAIIYLRIRDNRSADEIKDALQPVLDSINQNLEIEAENGSVLDAKWIGRGRLRALARLE